MPWHAGVGVTGLSGEILAIDRDDLSRFLAGWSPYELTLVDMPGQPAAAQSPRSGTPPPDQGGRLGRADVRDGRGPASAGATLMAGGAAAIEGLTRGLAVELAPVRVNAVRPGAVHTPMWDAAPEPRHSAPQRAVPPNQINDSPTIVTQISRFSAGDEPHSVRHGRGSQSPVDALRSSGSARGRADLLIRRPQCITATCADQVPDPEKMSSGRSRSRAGDSLFRKDFPHQQENFGDSVQTEHLAVSEASQVQRSYPSRRVHDHQARQ